MKLWEVLKALEENPKKVFKCVKPHKVHVISTDEVEGNNYYSLTTTDFRGENISRKPSGGFDGNFTVDGYWHEVKQPVTWQEAFEAWLNGKTVFCFLENGKRVEYDQNINFIHAHSLKTGTWYIED